MATALRKNIAGLQGWLMIFGILLLFTFMAGCAGKSTPSGLPSSSKSKPTSTPSKKRGTYKPYTVFGQTYHPLESADGYSETGMASWYGPNFHGKKTANGETYNMYQMTAAHRILPMHTKVMVKNLNNGRSVEVRVNDRGPFVNNRIIDLSYAAADKLGVVGPGTAKVHVQTIAGQTIHYVGPFYVQYGAFVVEDNARRLRQRLVNRGFSGTRITKGELNGTVYWRVQIGAFSSLKEAESMRIQLTRESPDCFVIAD